MASDIVPRTPSPTRSPTPSLAGLARVVPTPIPRAPTEPLPVEEPPLLSADMLGVIGTTACGGGVILLIMAAVVAGLVWLYRLGWGQAAEIVINIDE